MQSKDTVESTGNADEQPDELQEYIQSLPNDDRELIKTIPLSDTEKVISVGQKQFDELIYDSLSATELGQLTTEQLERRGEIIAEIKEIREELIRNKLDGDFYEPYDEVIDDVKDMLQKVGITGLDNLPLLNLKNAIVIGWN